MKDEFNPVRIKNDKVAEAKTEIENVINLMNADIAKSNRKLKQKEPLLQITKEDIRDISKISLQLPVPCITQALHRFYDSYIKKGERIRSVGAMVRTLTWDIYGYQQLITSS